MNGLKASLQDVNLAREIVMAYGWNATSYQILNPGMDLWFSSEATAVVGYIRRAAVLLVAGAPVCAWESLASVCGEFETFARREGCRVCYVCAEERLRVLFGASASHAVVTLGAQPAWNPSAWTQVVRTRASLRAQLHRAAHKGVVVKAVGAQEAAGDSKLRAVLQEWIGGRSLPPLHFLVEPNVLDGVLTDRIVLVAYLPDKPVALLVASPARARKGYLVELVARSSAAPNGSSELLIDAAMQRFAAEGCEYASFGLVALAHAADDSIQNNPAWLRGLMYFARAHANRFYSFRGIEQFRVKMSPERWETVYAISNESRFSARTLYALGAAFSGISPWTAIGMGIGKAVSQELQQLFKRQGTA